MWFIPVVCFTKHTWSYVPPLLQVLLHKDSHVKSWVTPSHELHTIVKKYHQNLTQSYMRSFCYNSILRILAVKSSKASLQNHNNFNENMSHIFYLKLHDEVKSLRSAFAKNAFNINMFDLNIIRDGVIPV